MTMRKLIIGAGCFALCAGLSWGAETAPFGSVVGWWRFNDAANPGRDSSEYGNDLTTRGEHVSYEAKDTGYMSRGCYDDSGCLYIGAKGEKVSLPAKFTWDTTKGHTYLLRARNDGDTMSGESDEVGNLVRKLGDKEGWHLFAERYDDKLATGGTKKHIVWLFGDDPTSSDDLAQAVADDASKVYFPLDNSIAIGGEIGATVTFFLSDFKETVDYKGYLDDVCVVQRTMTKEEIGYYYHYGDPNPYQTSGGSWSCAGEGLGYGTADLPGADFQVDCGRTRTISTEGGTFGGHSLILGRPADLVSVVDSSKKLTKIGNLTVKSNYTFADLRLFAGTLTGTSGKTLTVNKLTVNATAESPFAVAIASGGYTLSGAAVGGGWIKKTGEGTLDLTGLAGAVKVRLDAGKLKASQFDGYTGGIVLVSPDSVVEFTGEGALPTEDNKIQILFDGARPTEKTAVMTVPDGVTKAMIHDATAYDGGKVSAVTVENGVVYVEPVEDVEPIDVGLASANGIITVTVPEGVVAGPSGVILAWDADDMGGAFADWKNNVKIGSVTAAGGKFNVTGAALGIPSGAKIRVFVEDVSDAVEYLASTGPSAWVDTGIIGQYGDIYEIDFMMLDGSGNNVFVVGSCDDTTTGRFAPLHFNSKDLQNDFQQDVNDSTGSLVLYNDGSSKEGGTIGGKASKFKFNTRYRAVSDLTYGARKLSIEEVGGDHAVSSTEWNYTTAIANTKYPLYLFTRNQTGTANTANAAVCRIYGFKVTRGGKVIQDLVPTADGFYDKATQNTLVAGDTSSALEAGPAVVLTAASSSTIDYAAGDAPVVPTIGEVGVTSADGTITVTVPEGAVASPSGVILAWDTSDKGDGIANWAHSAAIASDVTAAGKVVSVTGVSLGIADGMKMRAFVGDLVQLYESLTKPYDVAGAVLTDYIPTSAMTGLDLTMQLGTWNSGSTSMFFGIRAFSGATERTRLMINCQSSGQETCYAWNYPSSPSSAKFDKWRMDNSGAFTEKGTFALRPGKASWSGATFSSQGTSATPDYDKADFSAPVSVFGYTKVDGSTVAAIPHDCRDLTCYVLRIYEGSVVTAEYVPAAKGGTYGLYNKTSGAFCPVTASGFTVGESAGNCLSTIVAISEATDYARGGDDPLMQMTAEVTGVTALADGTPHVCGLLVTKPASDWTAKWAWNGEDAFTHAGPQEFTAAGIYTNRVQVTADGYEAFVGTGVVTLVDPTVGFAPMTRTRYLEAMNRIVALYTDDTLADVLQTARTKGVTEHGFPRLTANLGVLIANGYQLSRKDAFVEMMDICCRDVPKKSGIANNFSVSELVYCLRAIEHTDVVPDEQFAAWKLALSGTIAYDSLGDAGKQTSNNWIVYATASEQARVGFGMNGDESKVESWARDQMRFFVDGEWNDQGHYPILYDLVTRLQYASALYHGFDGASAAAIVGHLEAGADSFLEMQAATGEMAAGGRSQSYVMNEGIMAALAEWYAQYYAAKGDQVRAMRFRGAALRAMEAMEGYLARPNISHTKNSYPISNFSASSKGCESYGYFDKYMTTAASWLCLALDFIDANGLPQAALDPLPDPTVHVMPDGFHQTIVTAGGYTAQFDNDAYAEYDAKGLVRIVRRGMPSPLALMFSFPKSPNYAIDGTNPGNLAVVPMYWNGECWKDYVDSAGGATATYALVGQGTTADSAWVLWNVTHTSYPAVQMKVTVSSGGVDIEVRNTDGKSRVGLRMPVFAFDGANSMAIAAGPTLVTTTDPDGNRATWRTVSANGSVESVNEVFANRNGRYNLYNACASDAQPLVVHVSLESAEDPLPGSVTTTEKVSLAYNRLDVGVTLATPGATGVKIVLKDAQGAIVATEAAEFTDGAANVVFRDLTPGDAYRYDVFLEDGGSEVVPTGWKTVTKDLFKSVDWFGFASGAFQKATPDANIEVADEMYASKDNARGLVTPDAAPIAGERTVVEMRVEIDGAYAWNSLPSSANTQISFGLVLKEGETADTPANRVWAYKLGSGNWTALPASMAPVADGTYDLRAVLDYRAGHKVASCTLTAGSVDHELFSNVPLTADRMNRVGVIGGCVAFQNAAYPCITSPTEVEPKGTEIELDASAEVDLAKLTAGTAYTVKDNGYALCWTDAGGRYATKSGNTLTAHEGVPANGLESFTSHALGLDPTDELDKPAAVVKADGHQSADGITVHVPNVVNVPDTGVEVVHQLQKSTDGGTKWEDCGAAVSVGGDLKIPFDGNLYRVNTVLR